MKLRSTRRLFAGFAGLLLAAGLAATAAAQKKKPPAHPIDLNRATAAQLERVPGIGPSTAQAILRFRKKSGPLRSVDDLLSVRGIGRKRLERMRPYLTVAPARPAGKQKEATEKPKSTPGN
jgi:competence ComEA-like helix-hairpin-helix protein